MTDPAPAAADAPLVVRDAAAWRAWLDAHEDEPAGVWLPRLDSNQ